MQRSVIPLPDICEFYLNRGMTAAGVAEHLGVTRQAISARLKDAGVQTRQNRPNPPKFEKAVLEDLYITEQLTVKQVAERLHTTDGIIRGEMEKYGIHRKVRGHHRAKYPQLRNLKIGESADIPPSNRLKPHTQFYSMASRVGIRVSVRSSDGMQCR